MDVTHTSARNLDKTEEYAQLQTKIDDLEARLALAKQQLQSRQQQQSQPNSHSHPLSQHPSHSPPKHITSLPQQTHFLLLLSDSALPLGSFAFSSGLESFLAHTTRTSTPPPQLFTDTFLPLSISSYASTTLPFVLASHRAPHLLQTLDDALDAATICTVARRASIAQGRALLGIWERSFAQSTTPSPDDALTDFALELRRCSTTTQASSSPQEEDALLPPRASAHLPPLFGAVARAAGLDARQTAFVFVLNHVKALVSAAVRRGMFGPYQAQKILAGRRTREMVEGVVRREWDVGYEEAGQGVPVMDLWVGRHEMLYSRIFNS